MANKEFISKIDSLIWILFTFFILLIIFLKFNTDILWRQTSLNCYRVKFYEDNISYRILKNEENKIIISKAMILKKDFYIDKNTPYQIFIYRLTGEWYSLSFNGIEIGSLGLKKHNKSNIWNEIKLFTLPEVLIKETNELVIINKGNYEAGISDVPIMIGSEDNFVTIFTWLSFLNKYNIALIGIMFFSFMLLISLSFLTKYLKKEFIFFSLSLLFLTINMFDYIYITNTFIPFIVFKKIVSTSYFLSLCFLSLSLYIIFRNKVNLIISLISFASTILFFIITNTEYSYKINLSNFSFITIVNILGLLYISIKNFKKEINSRILFTNGLMFTLIAIYELSGLYSSSLFNITFTCIGMTYFALSVVIMLILHYKNLEDDLNYQKEINRHLQIIEQKNLELEKQAEFLNQEIKERISAEEKLIRSENRFRKLTELLPAIVIEIDKNNKITYVNKKGEITLGINFTEKESIDFFELFSENLKPAIENYLKNLLDNDTKNMVGIELNLKKENIPVLLYASPIFEEVPLTELKDSNKDKIFNGYRFVIIEIEKTLLTMLMPSDKFYNQYKLTEREIEIIELIIKGFKNKEIADKLFISEPTVKTHIYNIYMKLNIKNREELFELIREYQIKNYGYNSYMASVIKNLLL